MASTGPYVEYAIMPFRRLILAAALTATLVLSILSTFARPISAQEADAEAISWRFAPVFIFGDERAILALNMLIDEDAIEAAAPTPVALEYGDPQILATLGGIPAGDEVPLLQAAGIVDMDGQVSGLQEVRACRVWVPADHETLAVVATALSAELVRVFGEFGLDITPCDLTSDVAGADLYVFTDEIAPSVDFGAYRFEGGFLEPILFLPPTGSQGGGTGGGAGPAPADTGTGLSDATDATDTRRSALAGVVAAVILLAAGRTMAPSRVL